MMGNRSEFLYAWFGILKLGAIEVPIHDAARGPGISHILNTTEARVVIVEDVFLGHVLPWLGDSPSVEHVVRRRERSADANGGRPLHDFADLLANPASVETVEVEPRQPASILFTGGTTGPPKGVVLPHNHNINLATSTAEVAGYTEDDVLLSVFPLFHANAKYMTVGCRDGRRRQVDRQPALLGQPVLGPVPPRGRHRVQRHGRDAADPDEAAGGPG